MQGAVSYGLRAMLPSLLLEKSGILREATGRQRGKLYVYDEYLKILSEGTEPF